MLVADVNGNGTDDMVRFRVGGRVEVSWEGRSEWRALVTASSLVQLAGRFDSAAGADLLLVDDDRVGRLFDRASGRMVTHSLYAY